VKRWKKSYYEKIVEKNYLFLSASINMYEHILSKIKNKKKVEILDIGCSRGYGTYLLGLKLKKTKITGIDINKKDLEFANKNFKTKNITYKYLDILKIKKQIKKNDYVICLEVFEHINPKKSKIFLRNIKKMLKKNGKLFFSTPNKKIYDIYTNTEGHINEVSYNKVNKLFSKNKIKVIDAFGVGINSEILHKIIIKLNLNVRKQKNILNKIIRISFISFFYPLLFLERIVRPFNKRISFMLLKRVYKLNKNPKNSLIMFFTLQKEI